MRPNPTSGSAVIGFELPTREQVEIEIVDVTGRRVRTLSRREAFPPGVHSITWDGTDDHGVQAASGIYFVRFQAAGRLDSRRLALLR